MVSFDTWETLISGINNHFVITQPSLPMLKIAFVLQELFTCFSNHLYNVNELSHEKV